MTFNINTSTNPVSSTRCLGGGGGCSPAVALGATLRLIVPKGQLITNQCCVTTKKGKDLIYTAAEA